MNAAKAGASSWKSDMTLALLAMLVALAVNAATGFHELSNAGGDNDSLLRLVEVRDMLAGQGWFDLHQYRMGLEGGFIMAIARAILFAVARTDNTSQTASIR